MAKTIPIKSITGIDIQCRHPRHLVCMTDILYAQLANDIDGLLKESLSHLNESERRNVSISIALYLEDLQSNTHLFETFTSIYQKMFGPYLPFYHSANAQDDQAEVDAMRFMLWLCCSAEREGKMLNPTNDGIRVLAQRVVQLWHEKKKVIPANNELADFLYSEEVQSDSVMVRLVLIWLSRYSHLGRWYTNRPPSENLSEFFGQGDQDMLEYANDCFSLAELRTWPLSLAPQHIYAEMIRIDMDDPDDELAAAIDHLAYKPLGIFKVVGGDSKTIKLKDYQDEVISVYRTDFNGNTKKLEKENKYIAGAFICLDGQWSLNGPSLWMNPTDEFYENRRQQQLQHDHAMNDYKGQYDDFIQRHGGEKLYFFKDLNQYRKWLQQEHGIPSPDLSFFRDYEDKPLAVYFESNGQMTMCMKPECIRHPDNPFYHQQAAEEEGLMFIAMQDVCSPEMLLHLMEHNLLADALINDMRGFLHGQTLLQDNMEFLARCMRRDISSDQVFHKRSVIPHHLTSQGINWKYYEKYPYEEFVKLIAQEKSFLSRANKEWSVVRANNTTTVIRDVSNRINFEIPTRELYEAHLNLDKFDIQIAYVAPYVGKQNAPAASALLYNVVGTGQPMNNLRKLASQLMRNWKKKK